jgi:CubicO group peptidase (beta-lactamase class C family)
MRSAINSAGLSKNALRCTTLNNPEVPPLVDDTRSQDELFHAAFAILCNAIAKRAFPSASVAVTLQNRLVALKAFGTHTYEGDSPAVSPATIFDVASLTKVVASTTIAMLLYQRGLLDLEAPVDAIVPEFIADSAKDVRRRDVTIHMLLAHSSGLPAYAKLFLQNKNREPLLHAAFTTPLTAEPGSRAEYSDIGFIILGFALERIADEPLDSFSKRELFAPLGMIDTGFNPPRAIRECIAPSADDRIFRKRIIQGEVQDENASVMGGVAGHAGIFATAADLARFGNAMANASGSILRPETIALFTRRETTPVGTSRALGWDTPSSASQSGKYFGDSSFGHLGYTGTSLWVDPTPQLSITLLTNRTWPDCSSQAIKQVRPAFHDAVIEAIKSGGRP